MPQVAELGSLTVALLVEPSLWVSGALVRLIGALLLVEVTLGIAARARTLVVLAILAAEALDRRPRRDPRPADRGVVARQQRLRLRLRHHRLQELGRDLAAQQPVPVRREARVIPRRIVSPRPTNQRNRRSNSIRSIS